jgi:DinB family protein
MDADLQHHLERLDRQRAALLARLGTYTEAQQAFRAASSSWSLADVAQHLVLVEERMVHYGRQMEGRRPGRTTIGSRVRFWLILRLFARGMRLRAPVTTVVPDAHVGLPALAERWERARHCVADYVAEFTGSSKAAPAFRHPVCGWLSARDGLRFLEAHVAHHVRQIERILADPGFPRGA